ncbi:MAG: biotin--[acetyl-CoA-carboxylase] ligase [Crocinitomicaceae bacterium]
MAYKRLERILIQLDTIDSTNNYAAKLLKSTKVSEGTVIMADWQHKGRGQRTNVWTAEPGKNLTFSVIFYPELSVDRSFYLNIMASLAIRKALERYGLAAEIKWPNDILIREKKICGILIDNQLSGKKIKSAVVGIGLNVNQFDFDVSATSLLLETQQEQHLKQLLDEVYLQLDFYYDLLRSSNYQLLKKHYYHHLYRLNHLSEFEDKDGRFSGTIQGINENGLLSVLRDGTKKSYDIQEIKYC